MSNLWVAVTCEYKGSTFSHRAGHADSPDSVALHHYNGLLDEAGNFVRRGLAGTVPPQISLGSTDQLSAHEKLRAIENIVGAIGGGRALQIERIKLVLKQ